MTNEQKYALLLEYQFKLQASIDRKEGDPEFRAWVLSEKVRTDARIEAFWK